MVTQFGLNQIAMNFRNQVTKAVLNGTVEVVTFTINNVSANAFTLEFGVPSNLSQLTQIALADANGNILVRNNLLENVEIDARF